MVRSVGVLRLPLLAAGLAVFPLFALLGSACGGSDTIDPMDALSPDGLAPDGLGADGSAEGSAPVPTEDGSVLDGGGTDATLGDGGSPDAHEDADSGHSDTDAASTDAGAGIDARAESGVDAEVESGVNAHVESGVDAEAEAGLDAEAGDDAGGDAGADLLGSARTFAVLAGSAVTTTAAATFIDGNIGVSPGTAVGSLPPGQPIGTIFAGGPVALQAQTDLTFAYNTLAGMPCLPANNKTGVDLGGKTLPPAVYCFDTSAGITGNLVLDAQLDPNAKWVIQVGSTLTTATGATVSVINGGSACNVYWQIGSSATLGTGTALVGNIVALTSITLVTGSTVLVGRTLARNGGVAFDGDTVSAATCQ